MNQSIYEYVKTFTSRKLVFIDVDHTLTANPWDTQEKDLLDRDLTNKAIEKLQEQNYFCIITTSRTPEMCMSEAQYELSKRKYDFIRPQPHMGIDNNGKRFYIKPEEFFPEKILDLPIIISSSGACIHVLQENGGYAIDRDFYPQDFPDPAIWRKNTTSYLSGLNIPFLFGHIENADAYQKKEAEIFPADYRIQLIFTSYKNMLLLSGSIKEKNGLYFTDDSNPGKNIYMGYITPKNGKIDAIEHVIKNLEKSRVEALIIGDSIPDLEAGLKVKTEENSRITFFLVGGSRLSSNPLPASTASRKIVNGNILFPGAIGPRSIVEFLSKKDYNNSSLD